jgi:hypothetical protein
MTPKKQVSPAIRILRGERDGSARAIHLEAATRKFLVTTNERKYMSTKTNFKRIALVAVASLGLGVLSSVPSQAAVSGLTVTVTDGTASFIKSDSTTAATINVAGLIEVSDSITITAVIKSTPSGGNPKSAWHNLDSSTAAMPSSYTVDTASATTPAGAVATSISAGLAVKDTVGATTATAADAKIRISKGTAVGNMNHTFGLQLDSLTARTAGTYVYTIVVKAFHANSTALAGNPDQTITKDVSIVVAAAAGVSTVPSAVTSFVDLLSAAQASGSDASDASITSVATASTVAGYIYVGNRNASNGVSTAEDSITATVTGAGQVCSAALSATPTAVICGKSLKVSAIGDYQFILQADGTAGSSSITVSSSVAGWSFTKSATFYASAAKTITATVAHPALKIGTNSGPVRVTAVDAAGTNWTGQFYIVASAAADALVGGSATTPVACGAYSATVGYASCDISTLITGTAKFKVIDAATVALATATSNEVTVTVTNATPASVKLSFDKATYAPNERARIYVTPLDSAGKEMQSVTSDLLAAGGISINGAVSLTNSTTTADSLTATSITTSGSTSSTSGAKAGSMVYTVYMPASGGTVTISATGGTGLPVAARVAVTATATVTDSGAAALAAVTALATTVASLKTLITTLTNLVLKIQKKVKA